MRTTHATVRHRRRRHARHRPRHPLLGRIPLDTHLQESGDTGVPVVVAHPDAPPTIALHGIAGSLRPRLRSLVGLSLPLSPA